jgi:hypothetical protein
MWAWLDERGGDLGQQRREQQVVSVADEQQLDVATSAELPLESPHGLGTTETSTQYQ